jgi:ethanolamine ammonia-lyase small subunit
MISNYKEYYENLHLQTLGVDSTQVLKVFAVAGAGTPRDQVMDDIAETAGRQPHVYVMMVKERPELTAVHRVMHFTPPMGGTR